MDAEDGLLRVNHVDDHMKRGSSENNLVAEFLSVPNGRERSGSKFSLIDKFADVSKAISDKQSAKSRKTPFSLFKKSRSREPSPTPQRKGKKRTAIPPSHLQINTSDFSDSGEEYNVDEHRKPIKKTLSEGSYGSDALEFEADTQGLEAYLDIIDEYYYGVRIFPGQDPASVYIGWVTPGFHQYSSSFDMKKIRNVVVCSMDPDYQGTSR